MGLTYDGGTIAQEDTDNTDVEQGVNSVFERHDDRSAEVSQTAELQGALPDPSVKVSEGLADLDDVRPTYEDNGVYMPEEPTANDVAADQSEDVDQVWRDLDGVLYTRKKISYEQDLNATHLAVPAALGAAAVAGATAYGANSVDEKERITKGRRNIDTAVNTLAAITPALAPMALEAYTRASRVNRMSEDPVGSVAAAQDTDRKLRDYFANTYGSAPEIVPRMSHSGPHPTAQHLPDPMRPLDTIYGTTLEALGGETAHEGRYIDTVFGGGHTSTGVLKQDNGLRPGLFSGADEVANALASEINSDDVLSRMTRSKGYHRALVAAGILAPVGFAASVVNNKLDVLTPEQAQYINYIGYGSAAAMTPQILKELRDLSRAHAAQRAVGAGSARATAARAAMLAAPAAIPFLTPYLSSTAADAAGY